MTHRRISSRSSVLSHTSDDSNESLILSSKELLDGESSSPLFPSQNFQPTKRRATPIQIILHGVTWLFVGIMLIWGISTYLFGGRAAPLEEVEFKTDVTYLNKSGDTFEFVHAEKLPAEAMPIAVGNITSDAQKWTIAIPSTAQFPLKPKAYGDICSKSHDLVNQLAIAKGGHAGHRSYYRLDEKFMDISQAVASSFLPNSTMARPESVVGGVEIMANHGVTIPGDKSVVCNKSLTFVMETRNAGFGNTLMELWMSYGLAQKEGRAFFVDDRNWAYGNYTDYFQPPPKPSCLPPPEHHRVPCPHQAQHLLISTGTTHWTFGHAFDEEFEDPRAVEVKRQKNIFALARKGFEDLFHLATTDAAYLTSHIKDLRTMTGTGAMVGLHVRHGDRHPWEFKYRKTYIPLQRYADIAKEEITKQSTSKAGVEDHERVTASKMVLASDDPDVYATTEMSKAVPAQDAIFLASQAQAPPPGSSEVDRLAASMSWKGGFTHDAFWSLAGRKDTPAAMVKQLREVIGRAYLLDLAVVGQADAVVCTASSVSCRLLAVMMGWENAILKQRWRNIDGEFDWSGIRW